MSITHSLEGPQSPEMSTLIPKSQPWPVFLIVVAATLSLGRDSGQPLNNGPQVNLSLSADQRSRDSARKLSPPDSLTGITLILNQEDSPDVFQDDLELASNMGFTWIQIQYMTFTVDHSAHSFPVFDRRTPSFSRLAQSIRQCKDKGLQVSLHPVLLIQNEKSQHWRGEYSPLYLDKWWASYSKWMISIATFCANEDVDMLFVGSELSSLQNLEKYWSSLIENVRSVYRGAVSYSANWDDWNSVSFHNDLDILGINGYFPLERIGSESESFNASAHINSAHVSSAYLRSMLLPHLSALKLWSRENQTAIFFSEVGYPDHSLALQQPWNPGTPNSRYQPELQVEGYRAFLDVFGDADFSKGIFFYAIHQHEHRDLNGYTPQQGKSREALIEYLNERRSL